MTHLDELDYKFEVIIVENGSTDATPKFIDLLLKSYIQLRAIELPEACLGRALREGFLAAKGKKIIYFPIDFSIPLEFIDKSIVLLDENDIVVGSKRVKSELDKRSLTRRLSSKAFHRLAKLLLGTTLSDTTCVKAYRRDILQHIIDLAPYRSAIYETELLVKAEKIGYKLIEIPVSVVDYRRSREKLMRKILYKFQDLISVKINMISIIIGIFLGLMGLTIIPLMFLRFLLTKTILIDPYLVITAIIILLSGIQLTFFGILSSLILKMREEINGKNIL
jgi:glycosyltransferase involved in cell wall biosynthesis